MKSTETDQTWSSKQEWFIQNILDLLANQKSEIILLTRRVTDLEVQNFKYLKRCQKEENAKDGQLKFEELNQSSNEM